MTIAYLTQTQFLHRRGHAFGTKKGRHIPLLGDTEGETEQKEGYGKEKARQKIKNSFWVPTIFNQED